MFEAAKKLQKLALPGKVNAHADFSESESQTHRVYRSRLTVEISR
jgi:hypothetical protein